MRESPAPDGYPDSVSVPSWMVDAFPETDWRDRFLQHKRELRAAKVAIRDIETNENLAGLEKMAYLQTARDVAWSARFQAGLAAWMYLGIKKQ